MLKSLREGDTKFNEGITFIRVDWDTYKRHAVTKSRRIPRRSTLVLIKGGKEVDRLVAATGKNRIKSLLEKGL
ncbi:MAG: thioredoxin family protein [Pseudomonadota bacterium]